MESEHLKAQYECLRRLFELAGDAIFVHGMDGSFTDVNAAACSSLGYKREELLGMHPWDLVVGDSREHILSLWHEMTPGEPVTITDELRRKDGSTFPAEVRLVRHRVEARDILIAICRDITKRKEAEAAQVRAEVMVVAERNRLAREIHDTLAQSFTGILLQLEAAEAATENGIPPEQYLRRVREIATFGLDEARRSVLALRPADLEKHGLEPALQKLAERSSIAGSLSCEFTALGLVRRFDPATELGVFRIAQEAVGNAIKHAKAAHLAIELTITLEHLKLCVKDDGKGIQLESTHGYGLAAMRERAVELAGTLQMDSSPGTGTSVSLLVPLSHANSK